MESLVPIRDWRNWFIKFERFDRVIHPLATYLARFPLAGLFPDRRPCPGDSLPVVFALVCRRHFQLFIIIDHQCLVFLAPFPSSKNQTARF